MICYYKNNKVSPNGDPEWIFQYCRFEWLVKYLLVYEKSHDVTLLTQWAETICEFYEKNDCKRDSLYARAYPSKGIFKKFLWRVERSLLGTRSPTYRSLDVAIRNAAILLALQHCVDYARENGDDNEVFTNELQRITVDIPLPKRKNRLY